VYNKNIFSDNECSVSVNGEYIGKATLKSSKINNESASDDDKENKIQKRCVGCAYPASIKLTDMLIDQLSVPSYTEKLAEVKNTLRVLTGKDFEIYYTNLGKILQEITNYAHEHNQIPKNEILVAGLCDSPDDSNNIIFFGRMNMDIFNGVDISGSDPQFRVISRMHSALGATEYSPFKGSFSIEFKNTVDTIEDLIKETIIGSDCISSFKGNKLDNSEKRGKKGKKIRNWEKKCFWQKGR
jgi:hypothetical protein